MCVTICGRFCPDEGVVAGYDNRIRVKSPAKWGVQIAGMIFQTRSRSKIISIICMPYVTEGFSKCRIKCRTQKSAAF